MTAAVLRSARTATIGIALVLCALEGNAQLPKATSAGTAAITGVVLDGLTERPIPGAFVTLKSSSDSNVQVTTAKGRFAFVNLPASDSYFLTTSKSGYLDGGHGRPDPRGPGAPLILVDGQWQRDVQVKMLRPGSISGVVADERGEPVVGAYVRVLPQVMVSGRSQWLAGPVAKTDDRGTYRIASLGPGKYLVSVPSVQATLAASATLKPAGARAGTSSADLSAASAADRADKLLLDVDGVQQLVVGRYAVPPPPGPDGQPRAYPILFYPGATTPTEATPVDLGVGESRVGIDLQLQPVRTGRVSGKVVGPADAVANLLLRLIPIGLADLGQGSEAATTVTLGDGRFTFFGVPVGSYVLESKHAIFELTLTAMDELSTAIPTPVGFPSRSASSGTIAAASPGVEFSLLTDASEENYWGRLRVDVSGPITDQVVLPLARPATISGHFVTASNAKPTNSWPRPVMEPAGGHRALGLLMPVGPSNDSAAFSIGGLLAGEYLLRVRGANVDSIVWEGQDYTDRPFDTTAGRDITGVVVTLTTQTSAVSGVVTAASGALSSGAAVIVFPVERERWSNYGFTPTRLKSVLTTMDGRFRLDGLPSGDYYFLAVPPAQERAWLDPAFLSANVGGASRLRVEAGKTITNMSLRLAR